MAVSKLALLTTLTLSPIMLGVSLSPLGVANSIAPSVSSLSPASVSAPQLDSK